MPVGQAEAIALVLFPAEAKRGVVAAYRGDALVDVGQLQSAAIVFPCLNKL